MNLTIETTTMKHSILCRLAGVVGGCLLVLAGHAGAAPHDDTEIYFNRGTLSGENLPNILFILDTSLSMVRPVTEGEGEGGGDRITALKTAMDRVLDDVRDINVGLMRFTSFDGGAVLLPLAELDSDVTDIPSETASYTAFITKGENDAREQSTGAGANTVRLNDTRIEDVFAVRVSSGAGTLGGRTVEEKSYVVDDTNEDAQQSMAPRTASAGVMTLDGQALTLSAGFDIGLQFDNEDQSKTDGAAMRIPPNALIEEATLEFEIDDATKKDRAQFMIQGNLLNVHNNLGLTPPEREAVLGNALPDFNVAAYDVYGRPQTSVINWNLPRVTGTATEKITGYDLKTPDLKTLVQSMVSQGCTTPSSASTTPATFSDAGCLFQGDKLSFRLTRYYNDHRTNNVVATGSGERVFESHDKTGGMAPRLNVKYRQFETNGQQALIGLRFERVRIPRGATVTDARLVFIPAADAKQAMSWTIQAEKTGNSAAFAATDGDLSSRAKTSASETWTLPDWQEDKPVKSLDLTRVVQEVTDEGGWSGGNALTFLISRNANASSLDYKRKFFSFEGDTARTVRLEYTYNFGEFAAVSSQASKRTAASRDDAEQRRSPGNGDINDATLDFGRNWIGLRFPGVTVPQNATITRAYMEFYSTRRRTRPTTYTLRGENSDDAEAYSTASNAITGRSYLSRTVSWSVPRWESNRWYQSADIKDLVQAQVKLAGWRSGNALAFRVDKGGSRSRVAAYDSGSGANAPRLVIEYSFPGEAKKTFKAVRERVEELVDEIKPLGATPIQKAMVEAANYWRGGAIGSGLRRGGEAPLAGFAELRVGPGAGLAQRLEFREVLTRYRQTARISHPGSYCESEDDCGNADTNATGARPTDKYGVYNPAGCDPALDPNTLVCQAQEIRTKASGTLDYISPFKSSLECQSNFQVLLTDGAPTSGGASVQAAIQTLIGKSACAENSNGNQKCTPDLAEFLAENDQSTTLAGKQTVKTYTIGFNLGAGGAGARAHLQDIAEKGKGEYYDATTADSLVTVLENIISSLQQDITPGFPAAPVAANTFNRLFNRDNIYFGAFAPAPGQLNFENQRWAGNLKKYQLCLNPAPGKTNCASDTDIGNILDARGDLAIESSASTVPLARQGQFKTTARSFWTGFDDGGRIPEGGAGGRITDYTKRTLYTDINNNGTARPNTALSDAGFKLEAGTLTTADTLRAVWDAVCDTSHASGTSPDAACKADLEWMLGKDVDDEDKDSSTADTRFVFSDPLHSSPVVMTYGKRVPTDGSPAKFFDKLLIGTNSGGLHFINGETGAEQWAFMPNALLKKQRALRQNSATPEGGNRPYGLDATPVLRIQDTDNDGRIEPADGDKVHVYMAMRRGGNAIYALDITGTVTSESSTSDVTPKFLWRIDGVDNTAVSRGAGVGKGNFSRMGQTFSEPVLATINTSAGRKTVLIFGGGYDTNLDRDKQAAADGTERPGRRFGLEAGKPNQGNAIYVVDADTGDLIFWIGHDSDSGEGISASGANIEVPDMFYSIAARVNVFDADRDGLDDRLYVGDTAGNVWRVDLGADISPGGAQPEGSTVVGRFANLSTAGTLANERRIFYRPAVVQVRDTRFSNAERGEYDYVVVVTGNRANPLADGTDDRLYALRDAQTGRMSGSNGVATAYPLALPGTTGGTGAAAGRPLNNTDLVAVSPDLTTGLTGTVAEKGAEGWYLELKTAGTGVGPANRTGEKALAPPLVLSGNILFTTYVPVIGTTSAPLDPCKVEVGGGRAYNLGILTGRAGLNWSASDPKNTRTADAVFELKTGGIPPQVVPLYTTKGIKYLVGKETPPGISENLAVKTYWYLERE